jgi:hypothetical protein
MPALTRRRSPEAREECWHIYFGDVHVSTIGIRAGIPHDKDPWGWSCGFYPGSDPGEYQYGTASDFNQARADFEAAWRVFSVKRTEDDYQAWRDQRDRTAAKYAAWERGEKLPSQMPSSLMRCPCGEKFDSHDVQGSYIHRGHIYARAEKNEIHRTEPLH